MLAVGLTSLEALSPAGYWTEDNNHCTSGGAPFFKKIFYLVHTNTLGRP